MSGFLNIWTKTLLSSCGLDLRGPVPAQDRYAISDRDVVVAASHGHDEYGRFMGTYTYFSGISFEEKVDYLKKNNLDQKFLKENYTQKQIEKFGLSDFKLDFS